MGTLHPVLWKTASKKWELFPKWQDTGLHCIFSSQQMKQKLNIICNSFPWNSVVFTNEGAKKNIYDGCYDEKKIFFPLCLCFYHLLLNSVWNRSCVRAFPFFCKCFYLPPDFCMWFLFSHFFCDMWELYSGLRA